MFRQFATCVKARLEVADEPTTPAATADNTDSNPITPPARPAETKAISATSVGFSALWAIIARFFRRLTGKTEEIKS
jgi:hypothetical protein